MQYVSEELMQKWQPVLEHSDLPEIKDAHRRSVTATLLENQTRASKDWARLHLLTQWVLLLQQLATVPSTSSTQY